MRKDYELMDQKIRKAYIDYIEKKKRIPTQTQIAEICGTTQITVSKHLTRIDLKDLTRPFKVMGNDVLMGLAERAKKGDARAATLYFALVYDFNEKHEIKADIEAIVKHEHKIEDTVKKYAKIFDKITEE